MVFYHKGLRVRKTLLPFVACARKTAILHGQIWSAYESDVVGLVIHWKTIFRPHLKKFEERIFASVEELYHFLIDPRFYWIYFAEEAIPIEQIKELMEGKGDSISSLFLPSEISEALKGFLFSLYMNLLVSAHQSFGSDKELARDIFRTQLKDILDTHRKVYVLVVNPDYS